MVGKDRAHRDRVVVVVFTAVVFAANRSRRAAAEKASIQSFVDSSGHIVKRRTTKGR